MEECMKETLGELIVFIGFVAFVVSVIALIRPMPRFKLPTRGRAGLLLAGSLVLTLAGGVLLPPRPATVAQAPKPERPSPPSAVPADMTGEMVTLFRQVRDAADPCEEAGATIQRVIRVSNRNQAVYDALTEATDTCKAASRTIADLRPPTSASRELKAGLKDALETCRSAYYSKAASYHAVARILDKGVRPSDAPEVRDALQSARTGQMECYGAYAAAAKPAGVTLDSLLSKTGGG